MCTFKKVPTTITFKSLKASICPVRFLLSYVYQQDALRKPNIMGDLKGCRIQLETSLSLTLQDKLSKAIIISFVLDSIDVLLREPRVMHQETSSCIVCFFHGSFFPIEFGGKNVVIHPLGFKALDLLNIALNF